MIQDILKYVQQMVPLGLAALVILLLLGPMRKRRLRELRLVSSPSREIALSFFVVFCAGLAALTLFPANFWACIFDMVVHPKIWHMRWGDHPLEGFYPSWEEVAAQFAYLPSMLTPFEEIGRALDRRSYWLLFMLLGNIIMFMPIGFFPALLWRWWRWWKSLFVGFCTSSAIETIQFFIGRSTDIDDVILNTAGALAGFWSFCLLRAIAPRSTEKFQCRYRGGYHRG